MINAINHGADIVELDIVKSVDNQYYIFHEDFEIRHLGTAKRMSDMQSNEIDELKYINNANTRNNDKVILINFFVEVAKEHL